MTGRFCVRLAIAAAYLVALAVLPVPAAAQLLDLTAGTEPVQVEATDRLEWLSAEQQYVAVGNATVTQGEASLRADRIVAYFEETADGGTEITRVEATGNVVVTNGTDQVTGGVLVYEAVAGRITITGQPLQFITETQTVTAEDSLIFDDGEGRAYANGNARAESDEAVVEADRIIAILAESAEAVETSEAAEDAAGLSALIGEGNVTIFTETDRATGDRVEYDVEADVAVLTGDVHILSDGNVLQGARAELDNANGIARLLADEAGGGRVRGLLNPQSAPQAGAGDATQ